MVDVLFVSVPITFTNAAPAAPAVLISMLKQHGHTGKFYDFNRLVKDDENFIKYSIADAIPENILEFDSVIKMHVRKMLSFNPKFIGISVFTYQCQRIAKLLCVYIKTMSPNTKIILGGLGLSANGLEGENLGAKWQAQELCDYWVVSEGEWPIIDIVKGNHNNKKEWTQTDNLDEFPIPDYSSYDWSLYDKKIPITGSRGCVRQCTFCDIHAHWKKFIFRSGKSIANEMISQSEANNIYHFAFTDSLINGSMKAYKEMCAELVEYNRTAKNKITWQGQFIFRPKNQMSEETWKLSFDAGLRYVDIGIESLSESVRDHMRKKFSNEDIIYGVHCMQKFGITGTFLMIVGYITDTESTIQENKMMYQRLSKYAPDTITSIAIGTTLAILPGTPLDEMSEEELGITKGKHENDWVGLSTIAKRLQWRKELIDYCNSLGYYVQEAAEHQALIHRLENEQYA
jgi:radical SAM superfamily enzyme YgiQ (UPF0313 family)